MAFWTEKTLTEMSPEEWESLCDGCGNCCLHVLQDEDSDALAFTNVACHLLNIKTCHCTDYTQRKTIVPECTNITADTVNDFHWLPQSCAYRRLSEGKDLPSWHYLVAGDKHYMHRDGHSVKKLAISAQVVHPDDYEDYIIRWVEP